MSSRELSPSTGVKLDGFTPGPLVYGDCSMDDPSPGPKWEVYVRHKGATAYCWKKADARLYAASPDLLAALKELTLRASFEAGTVNPNASFWDALERARAAIAKATDQ